MMMALAATHRLPTVLVPGGVTLSPEQGEDAGRVQSIGARFAQGQITLQEAAEMGCRACAGPGGGCQFLGTAATLSGRRRSARSYPPSAALLFLAPKRGKHHPNPHSRSPPQRLVVHAAFGGSTGTARTVGLK